MSTLARRRIRMIADAAKTSDPTYQMKDVFTNGTPELWRGNDVQFEIRLDFNADLYSVSNIASITMDVRPSPTDRTGAAVMTQTLEAADLDDTLTAETWADGTKQHALFAFTDSETNLDLGDANDHTYWLAIGAITTGGADITLGYTHFKLVEDGVGAAGDPPEPVEQYFTRDQMLALFVQKTPDAAHYRFSDGKHYTYNEDDGLWYPSTVQTVDGAAIFTIGEGESL